MITRRGRDLTRKLVKTHFAYLNLIHQIRKEAPKLADELVAIKKRMPDFRTVMRFKRKVEKVFKETNPNKKSYLKYLCPTCGMWKGRECASIHQPFRYVRPHKARLKRVKAMRARRKPRVLVGSMGDYEIVLPGGGYGFP